MTVHFQFCSVKGIQFFKKELCITTTPRRKTVRRKRFEELGERKTGIFKYRKWEHSTRHIIVNTFLVNIFVG